MVIVAVSGGSDSIALLLLASTWSRMTGVDIQAVTVDHGLRPEAAAEAAFVAGVSEALNIPHVTLAWDGLKPATGVSNAARNARYRLLEEFAKDIDVKAILVGHTANDQAETVLMRNSRSAGPSSQGRGLSGMARSVRLPNGIRLYRPLLGLTRERLRSYLIELNQGWIEDPSNHDDAYERVRVRKHLGDSHDLVMQIARFAEINGRERVLIADKVAMFLFEGMQIDEGPVYSISKPHLDVIEPPMRSLALQVMIATAGGGTYFVPAQTVSDFLADNEENRISVGNSIVEKVSQKIRVYRETRNLPSLLVAPGEEVLWDNRLRIINKSSMSYFCGPVDQARLADVEAMLGHKLLVKPRSAISSTPFLCGDGDDLYLPFVKGFAKPANVECRLECAAIEHFCPSYDYAFLGLLDGIREGIGKPKIHNP